MIRLHIRPADRSLERISVMSIAGACHHLQICLRGSGTDFTLTALPDAGSLRGLVDGGLPQK
jgi:hypothetical protein